MFKPTKKQHIVNKNYADKNGSSGGGTEPLIIRVTEEEVKDPQTQERFGFKTNVLASDAYEAWQSGRPIYRYFNDEDEWLVSSVNHNNAFTIYCDDFVSGSLKVDVLVETPFSEGYLTFEASGDIPVG